MKKFRYFPAIITFAAGLTISIVLILNEYSLLTFLWILAGVMFSFFIASLFIRRILNKYFADPEEETKDGEAEGAEGEEDENQETEPGKSEAAIDE